MTTAQLKQLALTIAPELRESPLYVMQQPEGIPEPVATRGYVVRQCAPLQQILEERGEWEGPGPIIVLVKKMDRGNTIVTLEHEVAHILPREDCLAPLEITPQVSEWHLSAMQEWADELEPPDKSAPAWKSNNHGKNFTRIALHLWWRAAIAGEVVDFTPLCAGPANDLAPAIFYWRALGNEAIKMQNATFAQILTTEPPAEFSALWYADLGRWMELHPEAVSQRKVA